MNYTIEERITNLDGKFYPEIHVWSNNYHAYGYRAEIWFDSWSDANTVCHMLAKEELHKIKWSIEQVKGKV